MTERVCEICGSSDGVRLVAPAVIVLYDAMAPHVDCAWDEQRPLCGYHQRWLEGAIKGLEPNREQSEKGE